MNCKLGSVVVFLSASSALFPVDAAIINLVPGASRTDDPVTNVADWTLDAGYVVDGTNDVTSRWTVNLTTRSEVTAVAGGAMSWSECMFKASIDGPRNAKFQENRRSPGYPSWFTVTTGPPWSDRVLQFLERHLEPWREGRAGTF